MPDFLMQKGPKYDPSLEIPFNLMSYFFSFTLFPNCACCLSVKETFRYFLVHGTNIIKTLMLHLIKGLVGLIVMVQLITAKFRGKLSNC